MTQTDAFIADLFADQSDDPILVCMTIDHADLAQPFRVVNDTVDLVSNSVTYTAYPFEFTPPEQRHGALYPAQITIDNVHRDIIMAIRDLLTAPTVTAFIVRKSDPDTVEMQFPEWEILSIPYDGLQITARLSPPDDETEPVVSRRFLPSTSPAIFNR